MMAWNYDGLQCMALQSVRCVSLQEKAFPDHAPFLHYTCKANQALRAVNQIKLPDNNKSYSYAM